MVTKDQGKADLDQVLDEKQRKEVEWQRHEALYAEQLRKAEWERQQPMFGAGGASNVRWAPVGNDLHGESDAHTRKSTDFTRHPPLPTESPQKLSEIEAPDEAKTRLSGCAILLVKDKSNFNIANY